MADFTWKQSPPYGTCITCGTGACPDGFVDMIADVSVTREGRAIVGVVDVIICADCLTQAARQVGCIPKQDSEKLTWQVKEGDELVLKLQDEASAWQQRYENLVEILSLIQVKNGDDTPDSGSDSLGSADPEPSPDLGVQEGRGLTPTRPRKTATTRK